MANSVPITALTAAAVYGANNITITATTNPCLPYLQVASYQIWASTTNDRTAATQVGTSTVPFWAHTAATPGTTYWYWAKTVDAAGGVSDFFPATTTSTATATAKTSAGLTLTLSASALVVPADAAGNVTSFAGAATTAKVLDGNSDVTAQWSFSVSSTGVTVTQSGATFTLTAVATDNGYFDITATRSGFPNLVARCTVAEARTGATGTAGTSAPALRLSATSQVFQVTAAGVASPTSITFTASLLGGLSGTPTFSVTSGTATLTGTGLTRALAYSGLSTDTATIQATLSGSTDTITVAKVREGAAGADGADAVIALLSNEAHTLQADSAGTVSSFTGAATTITIYVGATDSSASWTVTKTDTNCTSTLSTRTVTVTAMSADSAYVDITATRSGWSPIVKRFSLTKSKAGATGSQGTRGSKTFYVSGQSVWSDTVANNAANADVARQLNDVVTQYNATNFSQTKFWNGTAWTTITQAIDGNLLISGSVGATQISASYVYAGSVTASQVTSGTFTGLTFQTASGTGTRVVVAAATNDLAVYNSSNVKIASIGGTGTDGTLYASSPSTTTRPAIAATTASNTHAAIVGYTTGVAAGVHARTVISSATALVGQGNNSASNSHGIYGISSGGTGGGAGYVGMNSSSGGHAFYAEAGSYAPFTGAHDAVIAKGAIVEPGDIVVDIRVVSKPSISDAITEVERSSAPKQANCVGVFVSRRAMGVEDQPPAALQEAAKIALDERASPRARKRAAQHDALIPEYDLMVMNSLGEGLINVCSEGGDIVPGDLITTSSMPGKGMKQATDSIMSYTVAKAREPATFVSKEQTYQIACIYLCG